MRTFLRATLLTALVVFSGLMIWSLLPQNKIPPKVQAASALDVPAHCIPPELVGLNEILARPTTSSEAQNPDARKLLLAKKEEAERGALQCAKDATAHPPAKKPIKPDPPTSPPLAAGPTATVLWGIHDGNTMPFQPFIPTKDPRNMWRGIINGVEVGIVAGALTDENWQDHPDWPRQGALSMLVNRTAENGGLTLHSTPTRHGYVHFIAACGNILTLQATDGTIFVFDAAIKAYVNNAPACPTVTP